MNLPDLIMAKTKKKKRDVTKAEKKLGEVKKITTQRKIVKLQKNVPPGQKADMAALNDNRRWNEQNRGNGNRNSQNQGKIKVPVPQAAPTTTKQPYRRVQPNMNSNQRRTSAPKTAQKSNPTAARNGKQLQNPKIHDLPLNFQSPIVGLPTSKKSSTFPQSTNDGAFGKHEQSKVLERFTTSRLNPFTSSIPTIERSGIGNILENWKNHPTLLTVGVVLLLFLCFMGCFCTTWRWIRRIGICRWIRRKLSRGKTSRRDIAHDHRGVSEEYERLLISEHPSPTLAPVPNLFEEVLESLESDSRRTNNEPKSTWEERIDSDLKDYEDSFKATKEEERETQERNERLRKLEQDVKAQEIEIAKIKEKHESASSSFVGSHDELDQMEKEFRKKLEEQNRMYAEKLKAMREERARKEKEAAEELNRMRYQTQQCIAALLVCTQLRIRFDEKREEWGDSLTKLRQPLITVKNAYSEFQDEIKHLDPTDDFSMSCFQTDGKFFAKKVEDAQNMLLVAFNNLDQLSMDFEDRIFIRMIMKSCSEQSQVCDSIGYKLVEVLKSPNPKFELQHLEKEVAELKPHNIPTTATLMKSAASAHEEEYLVIETVPAPDWTHNMN